MGVRLVVAVALSPSAVKLVTFAVQPLAVRDQTASPRLPSLSKVHEWTAPVAGCTARICVAVVVWSSRVRVVRHRRYFLPSVQSTTMRVSAPSLEYAQLPTSQASSWSDGPSGDSRSCPKYHLPAERTHRALNAPRVDSAGLGRLTTNTPSCTAVSSAR